MAGAARGLPVKVIGFLTIKPSFWLVAKPEIKSIAELKNKIIGITAIEHGPKSPGPAARPL